MAAGAARSGLGSSVGRWRHRAGDDALLVANTTARRALSHTDTKILWYCVRKQSQEISICAKQYHNSISTSVHMLYVQLDQSSFLLLVLPVTIPLWPICSGREVPCRADVTGAPKMAHSNRSGLVSFLDPYTLTFCSSLLRHKLHYTTRKIRDVVEKNWQRGGSVVL